MITLSCARLHFVRARGWTSWLIARDGVQEPEFSHVDIILADGTLLGARDDSAGGQPPGVWIRPPDYAKWDYERTVTVVGNFDYAGGLKWAIGEIGSKYDEDAILGFILGQRWHRNGDFICSVLAGTYMQKCNIFNEDLDNLQGTSPNELYAMCLAVGGIVGP